MPIPYTSTNGTVYTQSCPSTDIQLSNSQIDENLPVGTTIGTFTTIDPDPDAVFTYSLFDNVANPDNAFFSIDGNLLKSNVVFNFEADSSYKIGVQSTTPGELPIHEVFTITITDVNNAPVLGAIGSKTVNEHALLSFTATATDEDLPSDTLTFSLGGTVPAGASIDGSSGAFTWTPAEDQGGTDYSFNVCVSDGAASDCETITVTVHEVNAAPSGADKNVTILEDGFYIFSVPDFGFSDSSDIPQNLLMGVKILSLPLDGTLKVGAAIVGAGDTISDEDIAVGLFTFEPDPDENDTPYASFQFKVQDDGGTERGGVDTDPTIRYMTINVSSVNDARPGDKTITGGG